MHLRAKLFALLSVVSNVVVAGHVIRRDSRAFMASAILSTLVTHLNTCPATLVRSSHYQDAPRLFGEIRGFIPVGEPITAPSIRVSCSAILTPIRFPHKLT
jgi:hypothetical protein